MSSAMVVNGVKVHEATEYKIVKKLNDVDIMTFVTNNDEINRGRFSPENDVYVEALGEWGIITRKHVVENKLKITWEQRAWHLKRRIYSGTSYDGTASDIVSNIVTSANGDVDFKFTLSFQGDVSGTVKGNLKHNNHLEALQSVCNTGNYSMRFHGTTIEFGKFNNVINVGDNKGIVKKLESDQDLNKYGNSFYIFGRDGEVKREINNVVVSETRYRYDRVISNSKIEDADDVANVFLEYGNIRPIVSFEVNTNEYIRYKFNVGDVLRVDLRDTDSGNNGFYRIVKMDISAGTVKVSLEFSSDGVFGSRVFDPSGTISYLGKKIKELELFR